MRWNLDTLFPKNTENSFEATAKRLQKEISNIKIELEEKPASTKLLTKIILHFNELLTVSESLSEYAVCLEAENTENEEGKKAKNSAVLLDSSLQSQLPKLQALLSQLSESEWQLLLNTNELKGLSCALKEMRLQSKELQSPEIEEIIKSLSADGFHAWEDIHSSLEATLKISLTINNETKELSTSQAATYLRDSNRQLRKECFRKTTESWKGILPLVAQTLNHIAGFRLAVYEKRHWTSPLKESLDKNRITESSLKTMWQTIEEEKEPLKDYYRLKAKKLNLSRLAWYDLEAPFGQTDLKIEYTEAQEIIIAAFTDFDPFMGAFAKHAFENSWIDSENRSLKRQGAFCAFAAFPGGKESRIMLTYAPNLYNVLVIAHELGHAYHFECLKDLPYLERNMPITLAETASQFAEEIVLSYLLKNEKYKEAKESLLSHHAEEYSALFSNIHARFLFETEFYKKRREKSLSSNELNEIMEQAQKKAFMNSLSEYNPIFWATKMHFYLTEDPFYNYPYVVGFMISKGLFENLKDHENRSTVYTAFLKDTGKMSAEEIANKHLNTSLETPDFWRKTIQSCMKDIEELTYEKTL